MPELFLDASYAIALASRTDAHHAQASQIAAEIQRSGTSLVTTRAVFFEIGNALARRRYRGAAEAILEALELDPAVEIVPLSEPICRKAWELYRARPDKEWGLTDCASFVVMRDRALVEALTADDHFKQAGFRALLLDA